MMATLRPPVGKVFLMRDVNISHNIQSTVHTLARTS
jgi:hypothetical protein